MANQILCEGLNISFCPAVPLVVKDICVRIGCNIYSCVTKTVNYTQTSTGCVATEVFTDPSGTVIIIDDEVPCPPKVEITNILTPVTVAPATPVPVLAPTCGVDLAVFANSALATPIINTPGTVLNVKLCPPASADREMVVLCSSAGNRVVVQNITPVNAVLGTAPIFEAWNLDGTPYIGVISALVSCGSEKVDVSEEEFCDNGVSVTRTTFYDVNSAIPTVLSVLWRSVTGVVIPAPAPLTLKMGVCEDACPIITAPFVATTWASLR